MLQNARFTAFTVSELLTKNQHVGGGGGGVGVGGGKITPLLRLGLKRLP